MKVTKLIVGIIIIVLAIIIFVQSIVRGFGNPNPAIHIYAGTAELIVSLLYLASGIVYIATCGIDGLGGDTQYSTPSEPLTSSPTIPLSFRTPTSPSRMHFFIPS